MLSAVLRASLPLSDGRLAGAAGTAAGESPRRDTLM